MTSWLELKSGGRMTKRHYLTRSCLILAAAVAGAPSIIWLAHTIRPAGLDAMLAALVVVPAMLLALAVYWILITRKRVHQTELAFPYQIPVYASLLGAAQGLTFLPMIIFAELMGSSMVTRKSIRYMIEPFLPLFLLLVMTTFVAFTPAKTGRLYNKSIAKGTIAATAYFIFLLLPHFWLLRGMISINPYSIRRLASLGMPPAFPATLSLLILSSLLFHQHRNWAQASDPASTDT